MRLRFNGTERGSSPLGKITVEGSLQLYRRFEGRYIGSIFSDILIIQCNISMMEF